MCTHEFTLHRPCQHISKRCYRCPLGRRIAKNCAGWKKVERPLLVKERGPIVMEEVCEECGFDLRVNGSEEGDDDEANDHVFETEDDKTTNTTKANDATKQTDKAQKRRKRSSQVDARIELQLQVAVQITIYRPHTKGRSDQIIPQAAGEAQHSILHRLHIS